MKQFTVKGKTYKTPIFLPDATRAVIRSLDSKDITNSDIEGIVVNTYHLISYPKIETLESLGGIKRFMNFNGLVASDSGGWQIFSLIHRNKKAGKITDEGVQFQIGGGKKELFTPEECIEVQFKINSDIIICLDDFTPPDAGKSKILESVNRTVLWGKKCKVRFEELVEEYNMTEETRPLLFAAIQGASDKEMRKKCAEELTEIGFDGYGFGGYLVDDKTNMLDFEMLEYLVNLIPEDAIRFSLGTGSPYDISLLSKMGWDIFDCTLPTRDARHKRLYTFSKDPKSPEDLEKKDTHNFIYINREKYKSDETPISPFCNCYTCKNYSKGYLNHLFSISDATAERLATIHNLKTYSKVIEILRNRP